NVFLIGILIGGVIGSFAYRFFSRSEPYSIHTTAGTFLKINKRTGETWTLYAGKWHPNATGTTTITYLEPAKSNQPRTVDWFELLLFGLIGGLLIVLGFVLTSIWKSRSRQQPTRSSNDGQQDFK